MGFLEISRASLKMYFDGNPPANQFLCRAFLCRGRLETPPATGSISLYVFCMCLVSYRYHFIVFNASVLYLQTARPLLQPGRCRHLVPSLQQVVQSLEEVADQDYSWRAELMMQVSLRCSLACLSSISPVPIPCRGSAWLRLLYCCVVSCMNYVLSGICRVALLLELALLALQEKHQKVAANCLEELKSAEEAVSTRYSLETSGNIARLKEIDKLDQWLQTAVKEGDAQAMQTVCAMQWSFCLPLLQRNFRRHIKTPLLNVAHVLEDMQSMLLEMRSQVHSELAVIEEEEGRLESSLTHLQKAMLLDNGTQRERLSSAARRLQLRGTLYEAPARIEDKAFMLIDLQPQRKTDIRPILVSVGLLLAPDDFQIVVDADDASGSTYSISPPHVQFSVPLCPYPEFHLSERNLSLFCGCYRVKLWATLAKTARKREAWDVCRAACRFCLLYDDGRWKTSETEDDDRCGCKEEKSSAECLHHRSERSQTCVKDLLRLLAEIHFISAEVSHHVATIFLNDNILSSFRPLLSRDWIQALSSYATSSFLRAAELGAEIREPWVVENAAIYLWNYSSQLLAAGEYQCSCMIHNQIVIDVNTSSMIKRKGLITAVKCSVCIVLLMQCENEGVAAMTRVLVGVEMLRCNLNPRHMEFSVPGLSALVDMASECSWPDAMVELQVWCQLATFCPRASDHSLLLLCTENVLKLKDAAVKSLSNITLGSFLFKLKIFFLPWSQVLISLLLLLPPSSLDRSYAEKAENPALCLAAARQCWNSCQPLTQTPEERLWLREPLEKILIALVQSRPKQAHVMYPSTDAF
uniref:Uncharacterized protein n=1 Tax=Mola mola TaxID=94237 RepID=A0A3Q3W8A3_MOLML